MPWRLGAVIVVACCCIGCGKREEPAPTPPQATPEQGTSEPTVLPESQSEPGMLLGRVRIVDLDGAPIPNMVPIATTLANAFEAPIAQGAPSDADGHGALWLPPDARVFVRAWDPTLERFANNFYDVLPAEGGETDLMTIQMIEGCAVTLRIATTDGRPLANTNIELMMLHPSQGPWWPARGTTDDSGTIHFERVPAGQYGFRIEAEGHALDLPSRMLPPGGAIDFGELRLQ